MVVNAAIELRVHAETGCAAAFSIEAHDPGQPVERFSGLPWDPAPAGPLALHRAALARAGRTPRRLLTRSDVPRGSGLGSSGALGVALVAVLDADAGDQRSPAALAEAAFQLEVGDANLPGGRQDQYAAALGGFHRLAFSHDCVQVEALTLDPAFAAELARRSVLCYTGASRVSSLTIARVMGAYAARHPRVTAALRGLVELADQMAQALKTADLAATGRLLSRNWELQRQLDPAMRTPDMARLEQAMQQAGILGGKAAGAGAGGSMFFLASDPARAGVAARNAGARLLPVTWATSGVLIEPGPPSPPGP